MSFKNYENVSPQVKAQIQNVIEIWKSHLGEDLIGIYLHGSIVLNCFVESGENVKSDIDILIITGRKIARGERLLIARKIIGVDRTPSPLEISAVWVGDLIPWKFPALCQFHYSDSWTERYIKMLYGEINENFIVDSDFEDEDIASYVHLINQSGICIYGKPIGETFPSVPEEDFWKSISADIDDYDFNAYNPRYFASNILILARILSYKREKKILSKYDGGLWALNNVPERLKYIIEGSLNAWYHDNEIANNFKQEDLDELKKFLKGEICS
ncbi:MAG: DUF4111 domain-containing protein [Clostridiales bacterium]|jgi:streptomycin 3"-adenylyltransferase|nr:DUF4111 domain-containing protein [Clostridiales bacterium]